MYGRDELSGREEASVSEVPVDIGVRGDSRTPNNHVDVVHNICCQVICKLAFLSAEGWLRAPGKLVSIACCCTTVVSAVHSAKSAADAHDKVIETVEQGLAIGGASGALVRLQQMVAVAAMP